MSNDPGWLDLGGSEVAELTESFWRDPDRLRYAAARLKAMAAAPPKHIALPSYA
jgi:hypothetical protein